MGSRPPHGAGDHDRHRRRWWGTSPPRWLPVSPSSRLNRRLMRCLERVGRMAGFACLGLGLIETLTCILWRRALGIGLLLRFGGILPRGSPSCTPMVTLLILARCLISFSSLELTSALTLWGSFDFSLFLFFFFFFLMGFLDLFFIFYFWFWVFCLFGIFMCIYLRYSFSGTL